MHSEICAGCGEKVGPNHIDVDYASGIKKLASVDKTEQSLSFGLGGRIETTTTSYTITDPAQHLFTLCEPCVRGYLRPEQAVKRIEQEQTSRPPPTKLWVELAVATVIPVGVAAATWNLDTTWIRWVALGIAPVWWALTLFGDKVPAGAAADQRARAAEATRKLADFDALPWAEVKACEVDLMFMNEAIVRTRGLDRAPLNALDRNQLDQSTFRADVITTGTPHDGKQRVKLDGAMKLP